MRTRLRWGAGNTSFVERDSARRLRGYDDRPTLVDVKNPKTGKMERVVRYDYRELVPLLRHRYEPNNPEVRKVLDRQRDVRMSIDARLEVQVARDSAQAVAGQPARDKGAAVVLDPATGDLLAAVSFPLPVRNRSGATMPSDIRSVSPARTYLDRARYGLYPPGSTFKVVTAMAALRKDPQLAHKTYECIRLPDGRVGNFSRARSGPFATTCRTRAARHARSWSSGIVVSCNAYFAQLGTYDVGAEPLFDTANLLGIAAASPNTAEQLKKSLPQSSYGQGQVVASPFQMARVAATVANGGAMPQGRWITDETNPRTDAARDRAGADAAATLGKFMREVVTAGTGKARRPTSVPMAGKTGTAELADAPSHAWFIGFAPYGAGGAQNRLLGTGGEWSVRRNRRRARRGRDCERRGEVGPDSAMSLFSDIEKTIERGFRHWTEKVFGPADSNELLVVHRAILEEVETKIQTVARGQRVFPFPNLTVTLVAADADRRALYQAAFGEEDRLEKDIRDALKGSGCQLPRGFSVAVETREAGERVFAIDYQARPKAEPANGRLVVAKGKAEHAEYLLDKACTNLGRMAEITDAENRVLHRNDVVFLEGER